MTRSHIHEEPEELDESIKKMRKYWFSPQTFEFESEIIEIENKWIRPEENYFYPEGGGQPADKGYISILEQSYQVTDVQEKNGSVWLKVPSIDQEEGMKFSAKIDEKRRLELSRNHSGQHLVSAAFWEDQGNETTRALIGTNETEIELKSKPSLHDVEKAIELAGRKILEDIDIYSKFYNNENLPKDTIRGEIEDNYNVYRLVNINNFDSNACGGTHVTSTGEITNIFVSRIDSKRIKFQTGKQAMKEYSRINRNMLELSQILTTPPENLINAARNLVEQKEGYQKSLHDLENKLTEMEIKNIQWTKIGKYKVLIDTIREIDRGTILSVVGDLNDDQIISLVDESGSFLVSTNEEELASNIMDELRKTGAKGGGSHGVFMGKILHDEPEEKLLNTLENNI